jgi:hypothetical protein
MTNVCPLCLSKNCGRYYSNQDADYLECSNCNLVFSPKEFHLNYDDEKARYDSHNNDSNDPQYRQFLNKLYNPLSGLIKVNDRGLDFGCGPGPTLSVMLEEDGYRVDLFDKFYFPDRSIFNNKYDFITATEVLEHLQNPNKDLDRLFGMLNIGGLLAVMTSMLSSKIDFPSWFYKDDPTHIAFYSKQTMEYIAKKWSKKVTFYNDDVTIFC